jgi:hypothetical protein
MLFSTFAPYWTLGTLVVHTFFNIIYLFQFNFLKTNNQNIHIGGINTFYLLYFPYFFPFNQANEIAKALFSLPWATINS